MNVTPVLPKPPGKPEAYGTTIYLNEMESGYLRAILYEFVKHNESGCVDSFASHLLRELDKYEYPDYNDAHPNWIKESDKQFKAKAKKGVKQYEDDEDED